MAGVNENINDNTDDAIHCEAEKRNRREEAPTPDTLVGKTIDSVRRKNEIIIKLPSGKASGAQTQAYHKW